MDYEVVPDKQVSNEWRCEGISPNNGDCYVVLFSGPHAYERAVAYKQFQANQQCPGCDSVFGFCCCGYDCLCSWCVSRRSYRGD